MKLQGFKRIVKENFPEEYRELVDILGNSINSLAEDILNATNKNLSVDDNLRMEYKDIEVSMGTNGTPKMLTQFKTSLSGRIRGMSVIKVENSTSPGTAPNDAPFLTWTVNNQVFTITNITGLNDNTKYRLTVLLFG